MQSVPRLHVDLGQLALQNPVMTASGTFGYGREFERYLDLNRLGAIVVKGISLEPMKGNTPPRTVETPCGMINSIGLENVGLKMFLREKLPYLRQFCIPVVVNILGDKVDDYRTLAGELSKETGIAAIELNISCPNVKRGGSAFGAYPDTAAEVVQAVRTQIGSVSGLSLMVKLTPLVTDIVTIAQAVEQGGADIITIGNTFPAMAVDIKTRYAKLGNIVGGLSGPAIRPIMVRLVWLTVKAVKVPVVAVGGIMRAEDALEYLIAGAKAVQVGTANLINPRSAMEVLEGIKAFLIEQGVDDINRIIGSFQEQAS